ncbi:SRPBCC family protein [Caulobacter sp. 17J65-9]|uniref:SRPBCC family protein n=1 Tax=Caulobacter sp. 17J65-9 TaxID=2709382 RepID=UPI0013C87A4D|nr:SRPBCC family protein [Caulobacter sp. 17J65-9]NEX94539.1 vanillate O-demethylase oxidoreductase VanB [Caulobacter sp. 17J65-9]
MSGRIEKTVDLKAPLERVWRALTDADQFGQWFQVKVEGPFVTGEVARGQITHPGFEHVVWQARIVRMDEAARVFAYTWHPYAVDPNVDYSTETPTLVEFSLEPTAGGTRLTVVESGFENVPAHRRAEAFRMNDGGWAAQMQNIRAHVEG